MARARSLLLWSLLLGLTGLGCGPTFAPPVRSVDYGTPGRLGPGQAEVGTGLTLFLTHSLLAGFPVADRLSLEVAFDWAPAAIADEDEAWTMGSVGIRWTPAAPEGGVDGGWAADLELGAGGGVGGADHSSDRRWSQIPAGGAYLGAGGAYHVGEVVALYLRGRVQAVAAERIPTTLWWTGKLGGELFFGPVFLALGAGGAGYHNKRDGNVGFIAELLLGGRFEL